MHDSLSIEKNHQHGLPFRLLESNFLWSWWIFSHQCRWLSFSQWVINKASWFITSNDFLKGVRITVHHLDQILTFCNLFLLLFCCQCMQYKAPTKLLFFRSSVTIFHTVALLIHYYSNWHVTILQQQLLNLFDVAFLLKLKRGPLLGSSWISFRPSRNRPDQRKMLDHVSVSFP